MRPIGNISGQRGQLANCCGADWFNAKVTKTEPKTITEKHPGICVVYKYSYKKLKPQVKVKTRNGMLGLFLHSLEEKK